VSDLAAVARAILDEQAYLTLGTADADGRPWVSPVWYAHEAYTELFWASSPDAIHSRNVAARPEVAVVVFDSGAAVGTGQAVYIAATAGELAGEALARGVAVYSRRSVAQGVRAWSADDVQGGATLRLYRAVASAHWVLDPSVRGDHRVPVAP
jgi:uncharacterized protein YhbP (UPF0306 family)